MVDKRLVWTGIVLFLPPLIIWTVLMIFRDAIITQITLVTLFSLLPTAYDKFLVKFSWKDDRELFNLLKLPMEQKKQLAIAGKNRVRSY